MHDAARPDGDRYDFLYRFGHAEFDEASFRLHVHGQPVEVERRALEVLVYLLRHAGEVVTKDELLAEVWAGRVTVDKVLPNAINKLRKALDPDTAALLLTQPRVGYQLTGVRERTVVRSRTATSTLGLQAGDPVPMRPNFRFERCLGGTQGNEVWLAVHVKTGERRVFKYAQDGRRLHGLKREAALARVLQLELELGQTAGLARLHDWNFAGPPFFLESAWGGRTLREWSIDHIADTPRSDRLTMFLQIARTVDAAHRVGVLHRDLKPANLLVDRDPVTGWRLRVVDFGSGGLLDPARLDALGITRHDLQAAGALDPAGTSGSAWYLPPEVVAGRPQTIQSDVYALGLILYQMLAGDVGRPLAPGWERDIDDPLLREDITAATHSDPAHRLTTVSELVERLQTLDTRHRQRNQDRRAAEQLAGAERELARRSARRPYLVALVALLGGGLLTTGWLLHDARQAREEARTELQTVKALNDFINQDLIGQANPAINGRRAEATVRDVLVAARDRVGDRFDAHPRVAARIHSTLSGLFGSIEMLDLAEQEARQALAIQERTEGAREAGTLRARATLVRQLSRLGRHAEVDAELARLATDDRSRASPQQALYFALAQGMALVNRGDIPGGIPYLEQAVALYPEAEPDDAASIDALRIDLAQVYTRNGQEDAADALMLRLIDELQRRDPARPLQLAMARQVLGDVRTRQGRYADAERLLEQAAPVLLGTMGEHSVNAMMLATSRSLLARKRMDWPRAIAQSERYLAAARTRLGEAHVMTLGAHGHLGQTLYLAGDLTRARDELRLSHTGLTAQLPLSTPLVRTNALWYLMTLAALGDWDATASLLGELDAHRPDGDEDDADRYLVSGARGMLAAARGRTADAAALLTPAVAGLGDEDPEVRAAVRDRFARTLSALPQR
ncbi:winged helix-turn-helix domain-containing protein [Luteimonas sp. RC10]|uniref:protein kinase domain-containing protein n=1 Tax=Luteimonas sp. RC10 TaxID=2587035 RepID=UPI0016206B8B|nr:winged helix-turn-helix domain-containing protein [Luteimonas sp. RC10]MBB3344828.1 non-specific serine/threonine protein kinase [Luteimonas sp. RC10]